MGLTWTRRRALRSLGLWMAGSPLLGAQDAAPKLIGEPPGRITPRNELVNAFEVEEAARRSLPAGVFAKIEGSDDRDREAFNRITFRPRMLVDVHELDLTVDLFGVKMYAPILVGPASRQQRFHSGGELALVRGAAATQTAVVISSRSSQPLDQIAAQAKTVLWYQVYPETDMAPVLTRVQQAVKAGCRAVCLTTPPLKLTPPSSPRMDWTIVDQVRRAAQAPVLLKGIISPEEARMAVERGADGIVVSEGGRSVPGLASPIEMLPVVVDNVGGRVPVLIDGGFRRGTDIIAALALGARSVLVARPVLWGLAAYGAEGVQTVLEMLQGESARTMGLCGKPNLAALDRTLVRIDRR